MANMHLVTGFAGQEHVKATDHAAFNAALIGTGQFVLDKGKVFEAQIISNNLVRVHDGELMMQGRFVRLDPDTYVDLIIENGAQDMKRNDLIVARYTKDTSTGVEEVNLAVIKGTAASGSPADPAHTEGDISNGSAVLNEYPLWRIPLDGLNVGTPVSLFGEPFMDSMLTLPVIRQQVLSIHAEVDEKIKKIDSYLKDETLSGITKTLYGLGADAVPDDLFSMLSRFPNGLGNEYLWKVSQVNKSTFTYDEANVSGGNVCNFATTIYYADTFHIDGNLFVLDNPSTTTLNYFTTGVDGEDVLLGRYFMEGASSGTTMYKAAVNAVFNSAGYNRASLSAGTVYTNPVETKNVIEGGYVNSPDPNAYPIDDGLTYTALGQLGNMVQIATGSYKGTGKYGSGNPCILNFSFPPKVVIISIDKISDYVAFAILAGDTGVSMNGSITGTQAVNALTVTHSGNSVSFYHSGGDSAQVNMSAYSYDYIGIG